MYYYCTLLHFLPFSQCCTVQARQQILQPTLTSKMDVARSNDNKYPSDWKATGSGLHTMASSTHMSLRIERPEKKGILFLLGYMGSSEASSWWIWYSTVEQVLGEPVLGRESIQYHIHRSGSQRDQKQLELVVVCGIQVILQQQQQQSCIMKAGSSVR